MYLECPKKADSVIQALVRVYLRPMKFVRISTLEGYKECGNCGQRFTFDGTWSQFCGQIERHLKTHIPKRYRKYLFNAKKEGEKA